MTAATIHQTSAEIATKYTRDVKLGEGTYAVVYAGLNKITNEKIAIKKIKLGQYKEGMDMSAIREVKFLQELHHPNIIKLHDVYSHKQNICLVLEYLETDMEAIIKDKNIQFVHGDIKSWMLMTLRGVEHCHRCWVLHRDIKPNNLLIAADGQLKLADFGLARFYGMPDNRMTAQVVTRWYRAPELLFKARSYGAGVDVWAVGCIFAELMLRTPFMAGDSDIGQLKTIFHALGTPTDEEWPGMKQLKDYVPYEMYPKTNLKSIFSAASDSALDLLAKMLTFDPLKRITAKQALLHHYFKEEPYATPPEKLPKVTKEGKEEQLKRDAKRPRDEEEIAGSKKLLKFDD